MKNRAVCLSIIVLGIGDMEDHGVDGAEKEVIRPENNAGDRSNHIRLYRPRHKG